METGKSRDDADLLPTGGPDFSGPHGGGFNVLFGDYHVEWVGRLVKGKITRHAAQ